MTAPSSAAAGAGTTVSHVQWQWAEPELSFRLPQHRVHARTAAQVHAGEVVGLRVEGQPDTVEALLTETGALGFEVARSPEGRTVLSWIAGTHHRAALNAAAVKKVAKIGDELLAVGGASLVGASMTNVQARLKRAAARPLRVFGTCSG